MWLLNFGPCTPGSAFWYRCYGCFQLCSRGLLAGFVQQAPRHLAGPQSKQDVGGRQGILELCAIPAEMVQKAAQQQHPKDFRKSTVRHGTKHHSGCSDSATREAQPEGGHTNTARRLLPAQRLLNPSWPLSSMIGRRNGDD